ncbi:NnrS family protein [Roseospira visakhapatnamensis]|uniref:Uncharacterized protein involved in response to NO n=1 Tax=Roseospira visakhapatnamensis TaxID=390880 RepID=A0A7W6RC70_9PROT|nr:NnrS family protein [Roseospira visakhapatnamensis]MBB4265725.1 uncharacterized protein involved in response to NO [Roseospira visakhapatnamensis]
MTGVTGPHPVTTAKSARPCWSQPFRIFFPSAALVGAGLIVPWLVAYLAGWDGPIPGGAIVWHIHEMVFGLGMAAVGGFLLTALPAWSGAPMVRGRGLAGLWAAWAVARGAALLTGVLPPTLAAALLVVPTLAFGTLIAVAVLRHAQGRHAVFAVAALGMMGTHGLFVVLWLDLPPAGLIGIMIEGRVGHPLRWLGDLGVLLLVWIHACVISRVAPVLGPEALRLSGRPPMPPPDPSRNRLVALTLGATVLAYAVAPLSPVTAWMAWAAAAAQMDRLGAIWIGRAARHSFFHGFVLSTLFLVTALALFGAARLLHLPWLDAAWHAAGAGTLAVGCLTVFGVASRRHMGGTLPLSRPATAAIWLAAAGAGLRVAAPFTWALGWAPGLLWGSTLLWSGAFLVFLIGHARLLLGRTPVSHPPTRGPSA